MTTLTASLPTEGAAFIESLPQELRDLIAQTELTWDDLRDLLDPRVHPIVLDSWI